MKKKWITAFLAFALVLSLTGCATADAAEKEIPTAPVAAAAVEEKIPAAPAETLPPVPAETVPVEAPPVETAPVRAEKLTKEQAQQIALDHVGVAADQVTRLRTEYEIDDGIVQFDVEFRSGDWDHEFEIHAEDGRILSYDKDHKYD